MTERRRRSLLVGALVGIAVTLLALAALRLRASGTEGLDAQLRDPGGVQDEGIATQGDVIGDALPSGDQPGLGGGTFSFTELRGRPAVVNFWATWCQPCVEEMPELQAVYEQVGERVAFVGINLRDDPDEALALVERTGVTYPLIVDADGALAVALEIARMPTTVFVGADGRVASVLPGALTADEVTAELDRLFPA